MPKHWFMGWWSKDEKKDCPEPWEEFEIMIHGQEAGETVSMDSDEGRAILKASGYRINLEQIKKGRD